MKQLREYNNNTSFKKTTLYEMCVCSRMSQREREIKPTFLSFLKILQIKIKINFINGIVGELFMLMGMNKWRDRRGGA
jgi:hypothetical protein